MRDTVESLYGNSDEEHQEVCDFLDALLTVDPFRHWESGRMNYWRYTIHAQLDPSDPFFRDNVRVWRADDGKIVALCISEYGKDDLFVEVLPEFHDLYPDIFRWVEDTWAANREAIEVDVYSDDTNKIRRLEAQGFTHLCHSENKRIYDLESTDLGYTLEEGFTIQTFSESLDIAGRVSLVRNAFDNTRYTEANLKSLMTAPDYVDEYNLSVVSPEGQQVAYCIGWPDLAQEGSGSVDPVGTHADFRRRGFATAIIKECFARLKANGIHSVLIASHAEPNISNFLYDSLSPQTKREVHRYRKTVESADE